MPKKYAIDSFYDSPEWRTLRDATLVRDSYLCRYCDQPAHQADHIIPRKRGGEDSLDNLAACCHACNRFACNTRFSSFSEKRAWLRLKRHIDPALTKPKKGPRPIKRGSRPDTAKHRPVIGLRQRLALKHKPPHLAEAILLATILDPCTD